MTREIPPYPLQWPEGFPRTPPQKRKASQFKTPLAGAIDNVAVSLRKFGADSAIPVTSVVATTNVGGIQLMKDSKADPGVAVWFEWDGAMRAIAVDRYLKPEENLQAIHLILEARRTEVRHGGIVIARTAFKGFLALPAPAGNHWSDVLGVSPDADVGAVNEAYRALARHAHPDSGGSSQKMARLNAARDDALRDLASGER